MPACDSDARRHSERLQSHIVTRVAEAGGWVSFADYMQMALYEPQLGYYSAGAVKFGADGDFVTAPEISPFFARTCVRVIDQALRACDGGSLLELGPGSGRFAAEALRSMASLQTPLQEYQMLEVSASLRAEQAMRLAAAPAPIRWLDGLPKEFKGVIFGNEIIDALPCERFVIRQGQFWRLGVGLAKCAGSGDGQRFEWRARPADGACPGDEDFAREAHLLGNWLRSLGMSPKEQILPEGYCGEWHPSLRAWIGAIAESLSCGMVLLADYGLPRRQLYHPERMLGSLRCHYRHHAHSDPFLWPGLTDITAWVDFTAVAAAGLACGLQLGGFTTQMAFLLGASQHEPTVDSLAADQRERQGMRQLLLPGEMGESVKFLMLTRGLDLSEGVIRAAFGLQDLRDSLGLQDL